MVHCCPLCVCVLFFLGNKYLYPHQRAFGVVTTTAQLLLINGIIITHLNKFRLSNLAHLIDFYSVIFWFMLYGTEMLVPIDLCQSNQMWCEPVCNWLRYDEEKKKNHCIHITGRYTQYIHCISTHIYSYLYCPFVWNEYAGDK